MWHPGAERLALSAVPAEGAWPVIDAHLAARPPCRDEAAAPGRAVATARAAGGGPSPTMPPVRVWRAIVVELGEELGAGGTSQHRTRRTESLPIVRGSAPRSGRGGGRFCPPRPGSPSGSRPPDRPRQLRWRRRRSLS
ncbi:hypothetical protein GCM10023320_68550 [Pseudonocardia adelaidensis]|uniref:Uncharacterized protein n=1 Tax=Pseudonocardia adelaidensis TaxID=648754 RepID=A0ABP9NY58_9PSEU